MCFLWFLFPLAHVSWDGSMGYLGLVASSDPRFFGALASGLGVVFLADDFVGDRFFSELRSWAHSGVRGRAG
jgi:hypothetical protein